MLWGKLRHFLLRFGNNRRFVFACQQPFVIECGNLPVKLPGAPCTVCCFIHIPQTCLFIFNAEKTSVMRPCQFVTQCVTNWEIPVKQSHITKVAFIKPFAKLRSQPLRQILQHPFPIFGSCCPLQLIFCYLLSNQPVTFHHGMVNCCVCPLPSQSQYRPYFGIKSFHVLLLFCCGTIKFHLCKYFFKIFQKYFQAQS